MRWVIVLALVLALAAACGGSSSRPDAQELVRRSLANMLELRSYRLEMEMNGDFVGATEFMAPGRYRFVTPASGPEGGVVETVWTVEYLYYRRCQAEGQGCDQWQRQLPTPIPMGAPGSVSIYVPGWPLTLLELAQDVQATGREEVDGQQAVRVQGRLNHVRAFLENLRRTYAKMGHEDLGQRCTETSAGTRECQPITFQDLLDQQKEAIDYYEAHPATLRAWIGQEDGLLHRLEVDVPPGPGESRPVVIAAHYVQFEGVEIKIPIVFSAPPATPSPTP